MERSFAYEFFEPGPPSTPLYCIMSPLTLLDTELWSVGPRPKCPPVGRAKKPKPDPSFPLYSGTRIGGKLPVRWPLMVCTRHVDLHARGLVWGSTIFCSCVVTP